MSDGPATIRDLTHAYVDAFHRRDLDAVAALMDEDFTLTDPEVTALGPRAAVIDYIRGIFEGADKLSFEAERVLVDGDTSAIEFVLIIDTQRLRGVDLIDWRNGRMTSMRAHLTAQ